MTMGVDFVCERVCGAGVVCGGGRGKMQKERENETRTAGEKSNVGETSKILKGQLVCIPFR